MISFWVDEIKRRKSVVIKNSTIHHVIKRTPKDQMRVRLSISIEMIRRTALEMILNMILINLEMVEQENIAIRDELKSRINDKIKPTINMIENIRKIHDNVMLSKMSTSDGLELMVEIMVTKLMTDDVQILWSKKL